MTLFNLLKQYSTLEELPRFANRQGVAGILYDEIEKSGQNPFDTMGLVRLSGYAQKYARKYNLQKEVITKLADFYGKHCIRMFLFKGYSLSLLYPTSYYRPSTDIDVYMYGKGKEGDEILKEHNIPVVQHEDKHSVYNINGITIENHATFVNVRNRKNLSCVEDFLEQEALLANEDEEIKNLYVPTPNFNALFLPYHLANHWAGDEANLKQLCDWAFFLDKYSELVDWKKIIELAKSIGFDRFLFALNYITVKEFNINAKNVPIEDADRNLADRILVDIMELHAYKNQTNVSNPIKTISDKAFHYIQNQERRKIIGADKNVVISFVNQVIAYLRHVYGIDKRSIWDMKHIKNRN